MNEKVKDMDSPGCAGDTLSENERSFCELYIQGVAPLCGNARKCYEQVFGDESARALPKARRLLSKPDVAAYIESLKTDMAEEAFAMKLRISENLLKIMEETSTAEFRDRWGIALSPAPLRAVSVNASKALMDLYPIRQAQELNIHGEGAGIVFNVVVPSDRVFEKNMDGDEKK